MIYTNHALVFRCVFFATALSFLCFSPLALGSRTSPDSTADTGSGTPAGAAPEGLPAMDQNPPPSYETATFGLGWFWGMESRFGIIDGVLRTRVGYAGGEKESPTYRSMGDHTEAVQLDYDPRVISYEELLQIFWGSHQPSAPFFSRQYMDAVFYQNSEQRQAALASKAEVERKIGGTVNTAIVPIRSFTMAEDYHQKYMLKSHRRLKNEMEEIYPRHLDFVNSTAVTRLNGYAGGYGTESQLSMEVDRLGLSPEGKKELSKIIGRQ